MITKVGTDVGNKLGLNFKELMVNNAENLQTKFNKMLMSVSNLMHTFFFCCKQLYKEGITIYQGSRPIHKSATNKTNEEKQSEGTPHNQKNP